MEPSSTPPSSYCPPPSSEKKSNQSNPHALISISLPKSFVCWWIPSSPVFLITLMISYLLSFSAASQSPPTPFASQPTPTLVINHTTQNPKSAGLDRLTLTIILILAFVFVLFLVLFSMAWFGCFRFRFRSRKNRVVCDDAESVIGGVSIPVSVFSWDEIQICTKGFEKVIDSGGFSVVYYGTLSVKKPILGALVFEYVPNGTLQQNLHSKSACLHSLPWRERVTIAYQLALALEYLHEQCELHIVHGDIKSSNILLDSNFNVKLCDFGSAKMGFSAAITPSRKHLITGSPGYVDPHYLRTGIASKKNDIYSFGVVVMELLTGLEAFSNKTGRMLTSQLLDGSGCVNPCLMDPILHGEFDMNEARVMGEIAAMCVRGSPSLRPSASEVISIMRENVRGLEI